MCGGPLLGFRFTCCGLASAKNLQADSIQLMERQLIIIFQRQIRMQCCYALRAAEDIEPGVDYMNIEGAFYGIQNFLNAVSNISKALWGKNLKAGRHYVTA